MDFVESFFSKVCRGSSQLALRRSCDFQLIGIFSNSLYFNVTTQQCEGLKPIEIQYSQAMIYAVDKLINSNSTLLPGIRLCYHLIDACSSRERATAKLAAVLVQDIQHRATLAQYENLNVFNTVTNNICSESFINSTTVPGGQVVGIIGERTDSITISLASLTSSLGYSQISYSSFASLLSNRDLFPYFYRISAAARVHKRAIFDLIKFFNWNWISVVIAGTVMIDNSAAFLPLISQDVGICFEDLAKIYDNYTISDLKEIVLGWKNQSKSSVIALFGSEPIIYDLLKQAEAYNITGKTFLGTYGWLSSARVHTIRADIIGGAIGSTFNSNSLLKFADYLDQLDFCNNKQNPWFLQLWHQKLTDMGVNAHKTMRNCTVNPSLKEYLKSHYVVDFISGHVIDSALAFAQALHNLLGCNETYCLNQRKNIFNLQELNKVLGKIQFSGFTSPDIAFQSDGAIQFSFDITNLQEETSIPGRKVKGVKIGYWNKQQGLVIKKDKIFWNGKQSWSDIPIARCSSDCPSGYYLYHDQNISLSMRPCCWECQKCPSNMISNITNSHNCKRCPSLTQSNSNHTECIDLPFAQFEFGSSISITFYVITAFYLIATVIIWIAMIIYRHTPVVKGSNFILTNLLLFFLVACIPASFLYLLPSSATICRLRMFASTTAQVGIFITIFSKTNQVSLIFKNAVYKKARIVRFTRNSSQAMLIFIVLAIVNGILLCLNLLLPISVEQIQAPEQKMQLRCKIPNNFSAINLSVWLGIIGTACLILAFRSRSLPENFNESRYIYLTSILIVAVSFCTISTALVIPSVHANQVMALSILFFGLLPLLCLFLPKMYIIYFRSELNTRQETMASITNYNFNTIKPYPTSGNIEPDSSKMIQVLVDDS
ncbi:uncharacterized protein TRIADDRAFT_59557 [Trichoplax adhaerens]|uniref:G-protein coupled receptors family 3 profile domain-containing protein n=1 Tax=Trichoplax adhaerens TaxID=10228 RepID=B3S5Z2_TRIAD|nr:hypothetical protein TRIADDRAFT_59557 [Trichoplax adhaerens]EDV21998.1 hypothetical protein TRIADDRAFT_59557 [Trichoplax adhaerens]|eukprot:XP_002115635.1 hypothetical protein TRIADDRAFT_59557 [Trichoplax adhaerens]